MSWLKDVLGFELFNAKDMWKSIRKDPERLLLGAVDPASTELWNKILHKDYEPMVDQMGGAYGGNVISWNGKGGVYKRAEKDGIDTGPGLDMQRAAHVIAALFATKGIMGMGGGAVAGAGAGGAGGGAAGGVAGGAAGSAYSAVGPWAGGYVFPASSTFGAGGGFLTGLGSGSAGTLSGISSGVLAPTTTAASSTAGTTGSGGMFNFQNMDWQDPNTYIKMSKMMPKQQQPQQQQTAQQPSPIPALQSQQNDLISGMNDLSWNNYLDSFYKFREMANLKYT